MFDPGPKAIRLLTLILRLEIKSDHRQEGLHDNVRTAQTCTYLEIFFKAIQSRKSISYHLCSDLCHDWYRTYLVNYIQIPFPRLRCVLLSPPPMYQTSVKSPLCSPPKECASHDFYCPNFNQKSRWCSGNIIAFHFSSSNCKLSNSLGFNSRAGHVVFAFLSF